MAWVYSPEGISKSKDKINKNLDRYCEICYTKLYLTVQKLMEIAKETKLEPLKNISFLEHLPAQQHTVQDS